MTPKTIKTGPSKMDLQINYENGATLVIPSSFLRKFSPSAENKNNLNSDNLTKFNGISISKLEAVGNYAIRPESGIRIALSCLPTFLVTSNVMEVTTIFKMQK